MRVFLLILFGVPVLTGAWWWWADRRLRGLRSRRAARACRAAVAAFCVLFLGGYTLVVGGRMFDWPTDPHPWLVAMMLLWALVVLPTLALPMMVGWSAWDLLKRVTRRVAATQRVADDPPATSDPARTPPDEAIWSRRQVLGAAIVTLPMLTTVGATVYSIPQKRRFRLREITVHLPQLPGALDGMTIAHVTDTHVGKFTRGEVLDRLARQTRELRADLVLLTGDLIDASTRDLPDALRMVERMDAGSGLFLVEGNHDLFDGRDAFERGVRGAGFPLLLDEAATVTVRGQRVQVLGTRWHGRGYPVETHVDHVASLRDPALFSILLAHHPHAFDRAAERGIPLTLAGHTHGGQLMLNEALGAGPVMFRYWSGLYTRRDSALVVSNGAGNWFPLRVNAPAEIVHVTLRRGPASA